MSKIIERFIRYSQIDTTSNENVASCPSNPAEKDFALLLKKELTEIGLKDILVDDNSYLYATIPANCPDPIPAIGFIAHLDTSPDCSGCAHPRIEKDYQGGEIVLNQEKNIRLTPKEFPELLNYLHDDIIVTDGTTLLGADDKAGVAAIVSAAEYLLDAPFKHGEIKICFTPDEEIGRGTDLFEMANFPADFAYTIDGGQIGELEYENFNAASADVVINGRNVHPGYAKDKMINAALIAAEFINAMPKTETPNHTSGYEGFYHLCDLNGNVEKTTLSYIIRDFTKDGFQKRKDFLTSLVEEFNKRHGENTVILEMNDSYYNMKEKLEDKLFIVDMAKEAMLQCGITPIIKPIRGGTDGARLSFMGLPTPNIFAGGHNFHSRYEFLPVSSLKKTCEVIIKIVELNK